VHPHLTHFQNICEMIMMHLSSHMSGDLAEVALVA